MTDQQRDALMAAAYTETAKPKGGHPISGRRVVHIREHRNGLASIDCPRCRRSFIAFQGGQMVGSASTAGCLI